MNDKIRINRNGIEPLIGVTFSYSPPTFTEQEYEDLNKHIHDVVMSLLSLKNTKKSNDKLSKAIAKCIMEEYEKNQAKKSKVKDEY